MQTYEFKACVVSAEINLLDIAKHFVINKKYKWEEPLILDENLLKGVLMHPENKFAYIFHFGSIVSVNLTLHEITDIVIYLKSIDKNLNPNPNLGYIEEYKLEINENLNIEEIEDADFQLNYDSVVVKTLGKFHMGILATILAKSVALKSIEADSDILLDELENIMGFLDKGQLKLSDKNLSKMSGKVLRFKYSTLSNLMLLEKPDVAWRKEEAELLFTGLIELFELKDRYERLRHKTEVLLDITEVFASLTHAKRGNKLEWMVIILIFIELILSFVDKIFR
jgi:required for meiotic nuclear division protein 1